MRDLLQPGGPGPDTFDWRTLANCAKVDPDIFFPEPEDEQAIADAKAICVGCPVTAQCITFRQENDDYGVWANQDPRPELEAEIGSQEQQTAQILARIAVRPVMLERACMMSIPVTSRLIRLASSDAYDDEPAGVRRITSLLIDERPSESERQQYNRRLELIRELGGILLDPDKSYIDWYEKHQYRWPSSVLNLMARFHEPIGQDETMPVLRRRALAAVRNMRLSPKSDRADVTDTLIRLHGLKANVDPVPLPKLAQEAGISREQLKQRLARVYSYHRDKADRAA